MTLNGAILHVGGRQYAMHGNLSITGKVRTGYILDNSASTFTAIFQSLIESGNSLFSGVDQRKGLYLDLGGGEHVVEIEFDGWEGSDLVWGNSTGAAPITQANELEHALVTTQIDSFRPATLEYGEWSSSGQYEPIDVAVEGPQFTHSADNPSTFTGEMVCVSVATFDSETYGDALGRLG